MFYHALAALLFAAACAWSAAAVYARLNAPDMPEPAPEASVTPDACRFRGLLLRREERLPVGAFPGTASGARLSAAETGTESALFFPSSDGLESLRPEDADKLTPEELEARLISAPPEPEDTPRLVYGFTLFCAAIVEDDVSLAPGSCCLTLGGVEDMIAADILSVTADALGRRMLLLKLTDFPEALYEMRAVEGEILP